MLSSRFPFFFLLLFHFFNTDKYNMDSPHHTVLIGGVTGLSTALYLAHSQKQSDNITIVDVSPDAVSAASGKANGILPDYGVATFRADLAHLSWKLYNQLAEQLDKNTNWGIANVSGII